MKEDEDWKQGIPRACSHSWPAAVEGDVVCVGGESSENAIWISLWESVNLNGVVGNRRN